MKENIALFDSTEQEAAEFIRGLVQSTGVDWKALVCTSNQGRTNWMDNAKRYAKYFAFPFYIFLNRKKYHHIIGWQAFYGLVFAFYCKLFHTKKCNTLLVKNFIYKPKPGLIGKVYFTFMKYIVKSPYVDVFVCSSQSYCDRCAELFDEPKERFAYVPFGINDFTKVVAPKRENNGDYILALGRSNRDWDFLISTLGNTEYKLSIVCDELKYDNLPKNITLLNNVWGKASYEMIRDCMCMVIPILDSEVVAGETVLLQAMSFSKPIIITTPSCLAEAYVEDGKTGILVPKNKESLMDAITRLQADPTLYAYLAENSRAAYEEKYSLYSFGLRVGGLPVFQESV